MRVSQHFKLDREQSTLDFVDVDVQDDVRIFLDPHALKLLRSDWGHECTSLVHNFFTTVLNLIRAENFSAASNLLMNLKEPNETHLGLSSGKSRGRALGEYLSTTILRALRKSEAVKTGLISDLEDTILMVEGIDRDIVSDIATNIIREPLIHYTQEACRAYGIPLTNDVDSGPIWDPSAATWGRAFVELPTVHGQRLLLVPKVLVRQQMNYDAGIYYRHFILESLRQEELELNSNLVRLAKDGSRNVTLKSLKEKYGTGKPVIERETLRHPDILRRYREERAAAVSLPLDHSTLAEASGIAPPLWGKLLADVRSVPAGREHAAEYEKNVEKLLSALFYPSLTNPVPQYEIHDGRKRIDITYTNAARTGFFSWLALHYTCPMVFVECKNYSTEVGNPELDQLSSRFGPSRGKIGILVCRSFENKELFMRRCIDTAKDDRGFIVPLDDDGLALLAVAAESPLTALEFNALRTSFFRLIS